jgi:hypothetical protein
MSAVTFEGVTSAIGMLALSHLTLPILILSLAYVLTTGLRRLCKHIHFLHLHARYGPVVRFAPNSLAINDPAALRAIYGHGANVQKSETFYHAFRAHPAAISTLLATEREHHARKRRIMGQAFSEGAMRELERYVLENVRVWEEEVGHRVEATKTNGNRWTEGVDMGKWCNYLVFGEWMWKSIAWCRRVSDFSHRYHGRSRIRQIIWYTGCYPREQRRDPSPWSCCEEKLHCWSNAILTSIRLRTLAHTLSKPASRPFAIPCIRQTPGDGTLQQYLARLFWPKRHLPLLTERQRSRDGRRPSQKRAVDGREYLDRCWQRHFVDNNQCNSVSSSPQHGLSRASCWRGEIELRQVGRHSHWSEATCLLLSSRVH